MVIRCRVNNSDYWVDECRARELTDAALHLSDEVPHARHARIRRRCAGADRTVRWILRHSQ
jgi:hypothetical protein